MLCYVRALDAYEKAGDRLKMADVANNVGIVLDRQGYYKKALELYGFAFGGYEEAARNAGKDEHAAAAANKRIADVRNNIGITYLNLGQYDRALGIFRDVERRYDASVPPGDSARLALNMGAADMNLQQYDEALRYFQQAQTKFEGAGDLGGAAGAIANQGVMLNDRGEREGARKLYEQALEIYRRLFRRKEEASPLFNVAQSYVGDAEYDQALIRYFIALKISQAIEDPEISWRSNAGIASCLVRLNRSLEAVDYYKAAIKEIESLRAYAGNGRRDDDLKIDFFTNKLHPYTALAKLLLKLSGQTGAEGYLAQAFEYADRGKAKA